MVNKCATFCVKIFLHYNIDIAIFVFGDFILPHPVLWYCRVVNSWNSV